MRATTSPWGPLTDAYLVGVPTALLTLGAAIAGGLGWRPGEALPLVIAACASPLICSLVASVAIGDARSRVVAWLASVPFDVVNVNGLLDGVGDALIVRFAGVMPPRAELDALLRGVHPDVFALLYDEQDNEVGIKIGVLDNPRNPTVAHRRRYLRVQRIVADVLLPLHETKGIHSVRIA